MFSIKQKLLAIERSTKQHMWQGESAIGHQTDDAELSKRAHSLKIEIAVASRRIEVISLWTDLLLETFGNLDTQSFRPPGDIYVGNSRSTRHCSEALEAQLKMRRIDLDFLERRAANQIAAVSPQH